MTTNAKSARHWADEALTAMREVVKKAPANERNAITIHIYCALKPAYHKVNSGQQKQKRAA